MKTCAKCRKEFPGTAEYFYRDKYGKNGLKSWCVSCGLKSSRQSRKNNPEYIPQWRKNNPEKVRAYDRKHYWENRDKRLENTRKWFEQNPDYRNRYAKEYRAENPWARISHSISSGIKRSLHDGKDGSHWESLVGYTINDLMAHLESQFTKGMSWDNCGEWHIDHIRPISDFNFTSTDDPEFKECWSLWNLQPMWAKDNWSKRAKCNAPPLPLLHKGEA